MRKLIKKKTVIIGGTLTTFLLLIYLLIFPEKYDQFGRNVQYNNLQRKEAQTLSMNQTSNCDSECQKFKSHMLHFWPSNKPKAVIHILTQRNRLRVLKRLLNSIDIYFNNIYRYPIIIFHENDLIEYIPKIRSFSKSQIYFQLVSLTIPQFLKEPVKLNIPCESPISYRHMCRFQAKTVYEQAILQDLDYYWRLDDDSQITKPITYDVFKFMQRNNYLYGYVWKHVDAYQCTTGLWEATYRHIQLYDIKTQFFEEWPRPKLYYNNFEISASSIWLSTQYKKYISYIDRMGGIYYFRWGDAPIKGIAVAMFVPKNQTYLFSAIAYKHGQFQTEIT